MDAFHIIGLMGSGFGFGFAAGLMLACHLRKVRKQAPRRLANDDPRLLDILRSAEIIPLHTRSNGL